MIAVDSSAIIAIVEGEPEGRGFLEQLLSSDEQIAISAVSVLECNMVISSRRGRIGIEELAALLGPVFAAKVLPFDELSLTYATEAFTRFGKGNHKAQLNFGDCASYALAKQLDAPLMFKGEDFSATDIKRLSASS